MTIKPKNDMMYQNIYNCICQNTKKWRYTIHYDKPTAQLLFKSRFPKDGPTCRREVVVIACNHSYLIHQCNRLITRHVIQSTIYIVAFIWYFIVFHPFCFILAFICISCYNEIHLLFLINRRDCSSHCLLVITLFYHIVPQMRRMLMLHGLL